MIRFEHRLGNRRAQRGSILVVALVVVIGVAMLGACLLQFSVSRTRGQLQDIDQKRAFYLAEAGLSEGIYGLMSGGSGNVGAETSPAKLGDGVVWVEATETLDDRIVLKSNGLCGCGRASLSIVVDREADSVASLGVFSNGDLVVKRGSVIDSYNSAQPADGGGGLVGGLLGGLLGGGGGGAEPDTAAAGRVGSNGNVEVQGTTRATTKINGDVTPGPNGTVTSGTGVTITGSTAPRCEPVILPIIEVPVLTSLGNLVHARLTPLTIAAGEHRYDSLVVASGCKLVITGPQTLVVGSIDLKENAQLELNTSAGDIELYATNYLDFATGSKVTNTEADPARARMLIPASALVDRTGDGIPDPPVSIASTGPLYATIYAPDAKLTLGNAVEFFGAVTAGNLQLADQAKLHFDEALLRDDGGGPKTVKLLSWRIVDLPQAPLISLRVDPVEALRIQGAALASPYDSHQTVNFKIQFVDVLGKTLRWAGDEVKFDWGQVQSVVRVTRITDADFKTGVGGILGSLVGGLIGGG